MQSRWSDAAAAAFVAAHQGLAPDLALRIYSSRLIGSDPALVLHGGGNTSVKVTTRDRLGRELRVLHVKGSGQDLAHVDAAGLPAVALAPLLELQQLAALDDAAMVNEVRRCLLDSAAPNPSVETLLHAFLPHAFVDHTHADAILALTDQPDGERHARAALGADVVVLPWIMPGFPLARAVAAAVAAAPGCTAVVLQRHGVFTFGATAKASYERMIAVVDAAERYLQRLVQGLPSATGSVHALAAAARRDLLVRALPVVRGALASPAVALPPADAPQRRVLQARYADDLAAFAARPDAAELCGRGPITPDHALRTKGRYLWLARSEATDPAAVRRAVQRFADAQRRYHAAHAARLGNPPLLDPTPAVVVVDGAGLVGVGSSVASAGVCADIAERTLRTIALAEAIGRYEPLAEADLFDMEYWPLERRKLGGKQAPQLAGQVALVTGAAGAIGCGIAEVLLEHGACVALVDNDGPRLQRVVEVLQRFRPQLHAVTADVTDAGSVAQAFAAATLAFGGVDIVVPNAGIAHVSRLEDLEPAAFARVLDVNVAGTMLVLQAAARTFAAQRSGGSVIVQASKNAFAPGAGFGAYSASKAATLQLMRVAALELAELGVRVNAINADAVFGDDEVPSQLWQQIGEQRMRARNLDPAGLRAYYRDRSLLKTAVTPRHVGEAVLFFASGRTPTTGAVLPVDGGLPEAFPR